MRDLYERDTRLDRADGIRNIMDETRIGTIILNKRVLRNNSHLLEIRLWVADDVVGERVFRRSRDHELQERLCRVVLGRLSIEHGGLKHLVRSLNMLAVPVV